MILFWERAYNERVYESFMQGHDLSLRSFCYPVSPSAISVRLNGRYCARFFFLSAAPTNFSFFAFLIGYVFCDCTMNEGSLEDSFKISIAASLISIDIHVKCQLRAFGHSHTSIPT